MDSVADLLASRPYPGRGCVGARTSDGELAFIYFLTGRSRASRARQLQVVGADIAVANSAGANRDVLRHYVAGVRRGNWSVIGNGEQVVPIAGALASGESLEAALAEHTFEPDAPIFTPRIVLAHQRQGGPDYVMGWVRRSETDNAPVRGVRAGDLVPGEALVMTTYAGSAADVQSARAPVGATVNGASRAEVLQEVWSGLDPALRVAAFAVAADDPAVAPIFIAEKSAPPRP